MRYFVELDGTLSLCVSDLPANPDGLHIVVAEKLPGALDACRYVGGEIIVDAAAQAAIAEAARHTLTVAVQAHLDRAARAKGYDSLLSAVSYIGSPLFGAEALAFRDWRDAVWSRCFEVQEAVKSGSRTIPTTEELLAELPPLVFPV